MTAYVQLHPTAIILDLPATNAREVLAAAVERLSSLHELAPETIGHVLGGTVAVGEFAIGSGVAVPHAAVPGLAGRVVALVRTAAPLPVDAVDGAPVDLYFIVLYPPGNPTEHLRFLGQLAAMCRSRMFREGLRAATTPREVIDIVDASAARFMGSPRLAAPAEPERGLAIIMVTGERAADTILMGLLGQQFGATIVDAQTAHDAASREVPLFAGFRDLFGDPGGRRVVFAQVDLDRMETLAELVRGACEEERSASAEVMIMPIARRWEWGVQREPRRARH